jgi:tetratricopeptide (TPR) repeat protein
MPRQKSTHVDDPKAVGERLRNARVATGLSQRQLAFPGCSPAYISRIEAGDRIPSLQLLRELGRRLNVTEDYLATGADDRRARLSMLEADILLRLDDVPAAEALYREALANAATPLERSQAEEGLGHVSFRRGEVREAISLYEAALVSAGVEEWQRPALAESLGRAYATLGEVDPAVTIFERCLTAFQRLGDQVESIRFSCLLGYALSERGDFGHAEEVVGAALAAGGDSLDPYTCARIYWSQAKLRGDQGDIEAGSRYAYRALAALQLTEDLHYTALAHHLVARAELERGNAEDALAHLAEGWPFIERSGTPIEQAQFLAEKARALSLLGEHAEAEALATRVTGMLDGAEPGDAGRVYALVGEIAAEAGDDARAFELSELAAELLERSGPSRDLVNVYAKLADLLEARGDAEGAYAYMKKAIGLQQSLGTPATRAT